MWRQIHGSTTEQTIEEEENEDRKRWELPTADFAFPKMPLRNKGFCSLTLEVKAERLQMGSKFSLSLFRSLFNFFPFCLNLSV